MTAPGKALPGRGTTRHLPGWHGRAETRLHWLGCAVPKHPSGDDSLRFKATRKGHL